MSDELTVGRWNPKTQKWETEPNSRYVGILKDKNKKILID